MENYIKQISSMKYRVLNGFVSPHKAIMLLAVIDMIEFELVEGNNFFIDDETKQSFLFNWEQYIGDRKLPYKANPWAPFWHLKHEPFWHLVPIDGDEEKVKNLAGPGETPHVGQMRSVIAHAKLDDELYELLKDAEFRDRVKQVLVAKYINTKPQDDVTIHHPESRFAEPNVILTHPVDWSPFEYGFTIEHKYHEAIFKVVGRNITRGSGIDVQLLFKGELYDAKITNANRQVKGDTIRLLYRGKKNTFGGRLKQELPDVYNFIKEFKAKYGGRTQCPLPKDLRHLLLMKETAEEHVYEIECKSCS